MSHFYLIFHFQLKYCRETDSYLIFIFFFLQNTSLQQTYLFEVDLVPEAIGDGL